MFYLNVRLWIVHRPNNGLHWIQDVGITGLLLFIFLTFRLQGNKVKLEADLNNERKTSEEKLELLQDSENRLKTEFENLANKILDLLSRGEIWFKS